MSVRTPKPPWLKVRMPGSPRYHQIKKRARDLRLATVCEEARCPNIGECWGSGTATFMVMGDTCTRGCRFCSVKTAKSPDALDPWEPMNLAIAVAELELDFVVVTSVDRDDTPDGGAAHLARCVTETRARAPKTMIEILIPDFAGDKQALAVLVSAQPDVVAHNIETVRRLTHPTRDRKASYDTSLQVLRDIKDIDPTRHTKSSIMVGLGETSEEVLETMRDLRAVDCDFLTIGQYLQPTKKHLVVDAYVPPETFEAWAEQGRAMGFKYVASGPLVRSSYKAGEFFLREYVEKQRSA